MGLQVFDFSLQKWHTSALTGAHALDMAGNAYNGVVLLAVMATCFSCYDLEMGLNAHAGFGAAPDHEVGSDSHEGDGESEVASDCLDDLFGSDMSSAGDAPGMEMQ